jgi:hypothetical protein
LRLARLFRSFGPFVLFRPSGPFSP